MSVRSDVESILETAFAGTTLEDIKIVTSEREIGALDRATILITSESFARFPAAPFTYLNAGVKLTIISAHQDLDRSEDELDDLVVAVMNALDNNKHLTWTEASKVPYGKPTAQSMAYEMPLTVITSKE